MGREKKKKHRGEKIRWRDFFFFSLWTLFGSFWPIGSKLVPPILSFLCSKPDRLAVWTSGQSKIGASNKMLRPPLLSACKGRPIIRHTTLLHGDTMLENLHRSHVTLYGFPFKGLVSVLFPFYNGFSNQTTKKDVKDRKGITRHRSWITVKFQELKNDFPACGFRGL